MRDFAPGSNLRYIYVLIIYFSDITDIKQDDRLWELKCTTSNRRLPPDFREPPSFC
jgi:hypothetical protein